MLEFQHAGFLFAVLLGITLVPISESLKERFRASKFTGRLQAVVGAIWRELSLILALFFITLLLCLAIYFMFLDSYYSLHSIDLASKVTEERCPPILFNIPVENCAIVLPNIFVSLFLGLATGYLIYDLYRTIRSEERSSAPAIIIRSVPIAILLFIGFFRGDIDNLFAFAREVKTPYFAISFEQPVSREARLEFKGPTQENQTEFQAGVFAYNHALRAPIKNFDRITSFCQNPLIEINCDFDRTEGSVKVPDKKEKFYFFENALDYALAVNPLRECLRIFKNNFANGVPIQDELSELAIDYARSLYDLDTRGEKIIERPEYETRKLIDKIIFDIWIGGKLRPENECRLGGSNSSISWEKIARDLKAVKNAYEEYLECENCRPNTLPYRAMVGSAILLMSGHSVEAARHIDREYGRWRERIDGKGVGTDFVRFQAGLEILAHRELLYDFAQLKTERPKKRKQILEFVREFLSQNSTVRFESDTGGELITLLQSCASGNEPLAFKSGDGSSAEEQSEEQSEERAARDVNPERAQGGDTKQGGQPKTSGLGLVSDQTAVKEKIEKMWGEKRRTVPTPEGATKYLEALVYYYIEGVWEYLEAMAFSGNRIPQSELQIAENMRDIAKFEPYLLSNCFGPQETEKNQITVYDHRSVRFRFMYTYAIVQALKAQEIQNVEVLERRTRPIIESADAYLCRAEHGLQLALALAEDIPAADGEGFSKAVIEQVQQARSMLRKIPPDKCEDPLPREAL